jgi:lysophospholipase L1-like esterase
MTLLALFGLGLGLKIGGPRKSTGGGAAVVYLPTLATAPIAVYGIKKLVSAYAGPLFQLTRSDGTGSPLDIASGTDGNPVTTGFAAWVSGSTARLQFYDQLGAGLMVQATLANRPLYDPADTQFTNAGARFLSNSTTLDMPISIAATRNAATMAMVMSGSWGSAMGLGINATVTNNLSVVSQAEKLSLLGGAFANGLWAKNQDPCVVVAVSDVAASRQRVDNLTTTGLSAQTSVSLTGGRLGNAAGASFSAQANNNFFAAIVYAAALSSVDEATLAAYLKTLYAIPDYTDQIVFVGDSLTFGQGSATGKGLPYTISPNLTRRCRVVNNGVSGSLFASVNTPTYNATLFPNKQIIINGIVANDINAGTTGASLNTSMQSWITARKATGWIVCIGTITRWTAWASGGAKDNERVAYNNAIKSNAVAGGYTVLDYDSIINQQDPTNTTYFADGTHPTDAGYALREAYARPIINGLL